MPSNQDNADIAEAKAAYQEYLKQQEPVEETPKGLKDYLETTLKVVGAPAGASRTALLSSSGYYQPGDLERAIKMEAPSTEEILTREGMPRMGVSDILPGAYREPGKAGMFLPEKGGLLDPSVRGTLGFVGDVATDPLSYTPIPVQALKLGSKAIAPVLRGGKALMEKLSHFTPEEATQFLRNRPKVDELKNLLEDKLNINKAQDIAFNAVNRIKTALEQQGLKADKEMTELLRGQNTTANLTKIKAALGNSTDPGVRAAIAEMEKGLAARRPMGPEISTTEAGQRGVQGLEMPEVRTQAEMAPATVTEAPGQMDLLTTGEVRKPTYGEIPQPPMASEAAQKDLQQYLEELQTKGAEYEASFPPALPQEAQEPLQLAINEAVTKGRATPSQVTRPGKSEFFPETYSPWSDVNQEVLPLDLGAALTRENAPISKNALRRIRQEVGEQAKFHGTRSVNPESIAREKELGSLYGDINKSMNRSEAQQALDRQMQLGMQMQDEVAQGLNKPLAFLKTTSEDTRAAIARAAQATGDKELFDIANQLGAARKMGGMTDGNMNKWLTRRLQDWGARKGLQGVDAAQVFMQKINQPGTRELVAPTVWGGVTRGKEDER